MKKFISFVLLVGALATLLSLGCWQVQRLAWKNKIITQLDYEYNQDPPPLFRFSQLQKESEHNILYGSVRGRFLYNKEILVGPVPYEGKIGYRVITPLKLKGDNYILVNRGWVDQEKIDDLKSTWVSGNITVTGLFRAPDWNSFTPENNPENNVWTKLDIQQIAQEKNVIPVSPYLLYIAETSKNFGILQLQDKKWYPRNKHKQYAIFWFTMAAVMLFVFGLYWRQKN